MAVRDEALGVTSGRTAASADLGGESFFFVGSGGIEEVDDDFTSGPAFWEYFLVNRSTSLNALTSRLAKGKV